MWTVARAQVSKRGYPHIKRVISFARSTSRSKEPTMSVQQKLAELALELPSPPQPLGSTSR
ncbi:hypothetical protein OKW42_007743 [Paraburkholderia sp. WC7.3d]